MTGDVVADRRRPPLVTASASPVAMACIPPSGTNTPSMESMYVMTAYRASASYGATPAYIAWNPKIRCSRSSSKNDATLRPEPAEPAEPHEAAAGPPAAHEVERRVEVGVDEVRHLDPVQLGRASRRSARTPPPRRGPANARISSVIASRPWRTWSTEPSAYTARYIGSTGRSVDVVGHVGAGGGEHVGEQAGHRQHGRPVVEPEPVPLDQPGPPAGPVAALEDGDVVAVADEVGGGGQPAEPGADDDDAHASVHPGDDEGGQRGAARARASAVMSTRVEGGDGLGGERRRCAPRARRGRRCRRSPAGSSATSSSSRLGGADAVEHVDARPASASATARASSGVGLPSRRSSPTGLPVTARVAERADHVVAHLEGVAERQPVARSAPGSSSAAALRARRARRRGAAAARSCTCRSCSGRSARPCRGAARPAPSRGCRGTGRR